MLKATAEHTFKNVASAWFDLKKDSVTTAYAEDIWRSLTLHVFPDLAATPISAITAPAAIKLLRPLETKGSLETVKRLSQRLNEIMTYGVNSGLIHANPLSGIRSVFKKPKKKNMASLAPAERAHGDCCQCQHKKDYALFDRVAAPHDDPSSGGSHSSLGRHRR